MTTPNTRYLRTPLNNFTLFGEEKLQGADFNPKLTFDVMNGNFRIKIDSGRKTPEGQKYKPWLELRLGQMPWVTLQGAMAMVMDSSNDVQVVPMKCRDVERDENGQPIREEGKQPKTVDQATFFFGKDRDGYYFFAVQEEGSTDRVKFKLLTGKWWEIPASDSLPLTVTSEIVARGVLMYLPEISAMCSVVSSPENPGVGVGGTGGAGNDGGQSGRNFRNPNQQRGNWNNNRQGGNGNWNGNRQGGNWNNNRQGGNGNYQNRQGGNGNWQNRNGNSNYQPKQQQQSSQPNIEDINF